MDKHDKQIWDAAIGAAIQQAHIWHKIYGKNVREWVELHNLISRATPSPSAPAGESQ